MDARDHPYECKYNPTIIISVTDADLKVLTVAAEKVKLSVEDFVRAAALLAAKDAE